VARNKQITLPCTTASSCTVSYSAASLSHAFFVMWVSVTVSGLVSVFADLINSKDKEKFGESGSEQFPIAC